jgi:hypothetical protein
MNTIKVTVHVELQGRTLDNSGNHEVIRSVRLQDKKTQKYYYKNAFLRGTIPASQEVKWTQSQYLYMVSDQGCPDGFPQNLWKKASKQERVNIQADYFCKSVGGTSFTVEIL